MTCFEEMSIYYVVITYPWFPETSTANNILSGRLGCTCMEQFTHVTICTVDHVQRSNPTKSYPYIKSETENRDMLFSHEVQYYTDI